MCYLNSQCVLVDIFQVLEQTWLGIFRPLPSLAVCALRHPTRVRIPAVNILESHSGLSPARGPAGGVQPRHERILKSFGSNHYHAGGNFTTAACQVARSAQ
jgi:hypothetical protein